MSEKSWVCLLEWRNMRLDIFKYFSMLAASYKLNRGKTLVMRKSDNGEWSELGYWEDVK